MIADSHSDDRRELTAFRPSADFPHTAEGKVLVTRRAGVELGNHSHPHAEGFFLVEGACLVRTWTKEYGVQEQLLQAPVMFMFEPGEEHVIKCVRRIVLVGYMPVTFEEQNNTPATHI